MALPMSLMIDGWMPSVGSSIRRSRGRITIARPMASCCCWPPERSPPRRPSISASTGKSSKTASGMRRSPFGSAAKPVSRFSRTVSSGKISRPCGTTATPRRARASAASRPMSSPSQVMRPPLMRWRPEIARMREVLPTPLRPRMQVTWPGSAVSDTAPERLSGAVLHVDVGELEHESAPQIDLDHLGIGRDVVERAFRQHRAAVQHGHLAVERAHERPCRAR